MTLLEALDWCKDNYARVDFIPLHGYVRVQVSIGGFRMVERNGFIEAVSALDRQVAKVRKAKEATNAESLRPPGETG